MVLNEGLVKIGDFSFSRCVSLISITFPSSVTEIGKDAFNKCSTLKEVVLNEGLKKIKFNAFSGCSSLESITIPTSVTEIAFMAFKDCNSLREVVCIEGLPKVECNTFCDCPTLERITFPNLSSRLNAIIHSGQVDVQNKIQQLINRSGIEWLIGGTIYIPNVARSSDMWALVKERVDQIVEWIKYYELREATTLFELALWKARMDQIFFCERDRKKVKMDQVGDTDRHDRGLHRVEVPGPVKDAILQYL